MASSIFPGFNNNSTLAVAHGGTPYITVYRFNDVTGYGTKYTDPTSFPIPSGALASSVRFINNTSNPAQSIVVGVHNVSETLIGYRFNVTTGFGTTKYSVAPSTTYVYSMTAGVSGSVIAAGLLSSPYLVAYPWNVGFGTKYANPPADAFGYALDTGPSGLDFNPDGTVLLAQSSGWPYLHAYAWSSGFGSKYADPTTQSFANGHVKFHPSGNFFVVGYNSNVYNWSSGYGTKYADPTGKPNLGKGAAWNPAGTVIAFSDSFSSGKLVAYDWSSGFGTKYTDATGLPATNFTSAFAWNPTGTALSVGVGSSPYVITYSWYNGFQKRYTSPSTLPGGNVEDIAFL
jgi:hypothetical protein